MEGDVWTPINERRKTCDYDKKLEKNRINRMFTSLCKISDKINNLESRILNLENIYEEHRKTEIERLKVENQLLVEKFRQSFIDVKLGENK